MPNNDIEIAAIRQAAADWLIRLDNGDSGADREDFEAWLRQDERHAEAFAELSAGWRRLDRLREVRAGEVSIWPWLGVAAAAAAAVAFLVVRFHPAGSVYQAALTNQTAAARSFALPDGSGMDLQPGGQAAIRYTRSARAIELSRGAGRFRVAANPAKPFVVSTGGVTVRALGTVFDVRRRTGGVEVEVEEGRVAVDGVKGEPPILGAGQRIEIAENGPQPAVSVVVSPVADAHAPAQAGHRLDFAGTSLADIVSEFNRYNTRQIAVADPDLAKLRFGGTFAAEDEEALVRMLERNFSIRAERQAGKILLHRAE